jgi:hypothetical protein
MCEYIQQLPQIDDKSANGFPKRCHWTEGHCYKFAIVYYRSVDKTYWVDNPTDISGWATAGSLLLGNSSPQRPNQDLLIPAQASAAQISDYFRNGNGVAESRTDT